MLTWAFQESITEILTGVPEDRNTLLFSATMSRDVERVAKGYLHDYKEIVVGSRNEGGRECKPYILYGECTRQISCFETLGRLLS